MLLMIRIPLRSQCLRASAGLPGVARFQTFRQFASKLLPASKLSKPKLAVPKANASKPPPAKPFAQPVKTVEVASNLPAAKPFTGTKGTPLAPPQPGESYPAQLLVYHAGTGLTVGLSSIKLTAIFIFVFTAVLIAPAYYFSPHEPTWMAPVALGLGGIPLIFMVLSTYPFVTYVHLVLPQWARLSKDRLQRYVTHLPPNAMLDITTLRWVWPRVTRLNISELYIPQTGLSGRAAGAMSLRRNVPQEVMDARRWYDYRPEKGFFVVGRSGKVQEEEVWPHILAVARKGWLKDEARKSAVKARQIAAIRPTPNR